MSRLPMITLAILLLPTSALAQGSFTQPLPDASLARGAVTVKVTGDSMSEKKVGTEVILLELSAGGQTSAAARETTGPDGRAKFKDLKAGVSYQLTLKGEGSQPVSGVFMGPAEGGLRFLASLGGVNPMSGSAPGSASPGAGGGAMPPGHPPTSATGPGASPKKGQGAGAAKIEPTDLVEAGHLLVRVLKGKGLTPVVGAIVMVTANPAAAATPGKLMLAADEKLKRLTDEKGEVRIQLPADKGSRAMILAAHDELTYRSRSLGGGGEKGLLATFQVFDRTSKATDVMLGPGTQLVAQVMEGSISFMQVLQVMNNGDSIYDPGKAGLDLPLPVGAMGVQFPENYKGLIVTDEDKRFLRLVAPLPPGELDLRYFFEVSFKGGEVEIIQPVPFACPEASISVINELPVKVTGPVVTGSGMRGVAGANAKPRLVYALGKQPAGGKWELVLSGLPSKDERAIWIVMGLAGMIMIWGVAAAVGGTARARRRQEQKDQLLTRLASQGDEAKAQALRAQLRALMREEST